MTLMWFRCHIPHLTPTQCNGTLTVCRFSKYSLAEACELARQGSCLEGVPDLRRGLLCTNGGGLTDAMSWRFTVYLQLSICGLSMARPPSLLICIFFLGDTGDGDALLSPSPSIGRRTSERRGDPFPPRK